MSADPDDDDVAVPAHEPSPRVSSAVALTGRLAGVAPMSQVTDARRTATSLRASVAGQLLVVPILPERIVAAALHGDGVSFTLAGTIGTLRAPAPSGQWASAVIGDQRYTVQRSLFGVTVRSACGAFAVTRRHRVSAWDGHDAAALAVALAVLGIGVHALASRSLQALVILGVDGRYADEIRDWST